MSLMLGWFLFVVFVVFKRSPIIYAHTFLGHAIIRKPSVTSSPHPSSLDCIMHHCRNVRIATGHRGNNQYLCLISLRAHKFQYELWRRAVVDAADNVTPHYPSEAVIRLRIICLCFRISSDDHPLHSRPRTNHDGEPIPCGRSPAACRFPCYTLCCGANAWV